MARHNRGNGEGRNNGDNNGNNGKDTRGRPHTRSATRNEGRNDSNFSKNDRNRKGLSVGTAAKDLNRMDIDGNAGPQKWNNKTKDDNYQGQNGKRSNKHNQGSQDFEKPDNRPLKRGNDGAVADNNPKKRHAPEPVRTRFSDRDIARTLAEAKRLLREFKALEARVNTFIPRDNRALWRFMNIQKKGLNAVKMCYYLHHAILDPEGDYDMDNETAKLCDCNKADAPKIPECYLLAMFYLICATNYESGLFNFSSPLTGMWPGKRADDLLADTMMFVPVEEQAKK